MALQETAAIIPQLAPQASITETINWIMPIASLITGALGGFGTAWIRMDRCSQNILSLEKDKEKHQTKIETLRTDMDKMLEFKENAKKFMDSKIYTTHSPLALSEFGKKLIKDSGFETLFPSVRDDLVTKLEIMNPKTQYDVQEKARALMDSLTEYPIFSTLKTFAFKNGVDFSQILRAGSILLRDYYLLKHPEIKE